jgi:plasmid replication initiation protein
MDNDYRIVKKNILNSGKFNITFHEYRIILLALSKINPKLNNYENIEFTVQDFSNVYNWDKTFNKGNYNFIRTACNKLLTRTIELELENETVIFQWFSEAILPHNNNKIILSFHNRLSPFINWLINNTNYTSYMLSNVSKMKSLYSVRIYELLKENEFKNNRIIKINDLREMIGLKSDNQEKNKYKKYADFKKRIIIPAQNELIKYSDIYFSFEEIKEFKKVVAIKFNILKNDKKQMDEFKKYNKYMLIHKLNNFLSEKLTIRITTSRLEKLHRIIIIDIICFARDGNFDNINKPYIFIEKKIDEICGKYDLTDIPDY